MSATTMQACIECGGVGPIAVRLDGTFEQGGRVQTYSELETRVCTPCKHSLESNGVTVEEL